MSIVIHRQISSSLKDIFIHRHSDMDYYMKILNLFSKEQIMIVFYIGFICPDNTVEDIHIDIAYSDELITEKLETNTIRIDYSTLSIMEKFYILFDKDNVDAVFNKLPHVL